MVKHLFKSIQVATLCGCLLLLNFAVYAQESANSGGAGVATSSSASTPSSSSMTQAGGTGLTRNADGSLSKTEKHKLEPIKDEDMLASITMLAIGLIGTRMAIKYRPVTMDVWIAAAGAAAFMAGEIMSNLAHKQKLDQMEIEVVKKNDGTADNNQIQRLQDLRKAFEEAKKTTGTKKMLQTGAAVAFAGAAAFALYLSFQENAMDAACNFALAPAHAAVKACVAAKTTPPNPVIEGQCAKCTAELNAYSGMFNGKITQEKIQGLSKLKDIEENKVVTALQKPICKPLGDPASVAAVEAFEKNCKAALIAKVTKFHTSSDGKTDVTNSYQKSLNNVLYASSDPRPASQIYQAQNVSPFNRFMDLFFPKAQAGMMPFLGLGAGIAAALAVSALSIGSQLDFLMFVPMNRAIAFGVISLLCIAAVNSSQSQMDKMDANIAKIDQILKELNELAKGVSQQNVNDRQLSLAGFKTAQEASYALSNDPKMKTDCLLSNGNTNCPSMAAEIKKLPGFANLPESFQSIASQAASMGDGLSGTNSISNATLSSAGALAAKKNAVARLLEKSQKMYNDKAKTKIDFNKAQKNALDRFNLATAKAIKSRGYTPSSFMAAIGSAPLSTKDLENSLKEGDKKPALAKAPSLLGAPGAPAGESKEKEEEFKLDFKEEPAMADVGIAGNGGTTEKALYDIGENDITTDSGISIFQLISNRYFKSGYPKLLEEDVVEAPGEKK